MTKIIRVIRHSFRFCFASRWSFSFVVLGAWVLFPLLMSVVWAMLLLLVCISVDEGICLWLLGTVFWAFACWRILCSDLWNKKGLATWSHPLRNKMLTLVRPKISERNTRLWQGMELRRRLWRELFCYCYRLHQVRSSRSLTLDHSQTFLKIICKKINNQLSTVSMFLLPQILKRVGSWKP